MTTGLSLEMTPGQAPETPLTLDNFAAWLEWQETATYAGCLDLLANALYRRELFAEGNDVKDIVTRLRERQP